jgi:phosphodiesterase/alkaline phosphatase D-like protein
MLVEVATTDSFRDIRSAVYVDALPESDFTAKALIENQPPGQDIFYRVSWTPVPLERTFGPQVVFANACSAAQGDDLAPCYGLQFFGHVALEGATETLTVTLKDVVDRALWSVTLDPAPAAAGHVTMQL